MKDIAQALGVSVATVSRALKDSPRISVERREAIKAYAREHNFAPNLLAESLRHSHIHPVRIIGVIMPQLNHFYFSSILSGIEEEASARGYMLMVAQSDERYEKEVRICQSFYENKVCGIIVSQAKDTVKYDHFKWLIDTGVPLVFFDRICTGLNSNRVVVDDYMGAFNAVNYLTNSRVVTVMGLALQSIKHLFNKVVNKQQLHLHRRIINSDRQVVGNIVAESAYRRIVIRAYPLACQIREPVYVYAGTGLFCVIKKHPLSFQLGQSVFRCAEPARKRCLQRARKHDGTIITVSLQRIQQF